MNSLPIALAPSSSRSSLLAAYNLWSNADFSNCLEELTRVSRMVMGDESVEATLLRARVYARLDRPMDALRELNIDSSAVTDDVDLRCSVKTLRGHALALAGRYDEATTLLRDVIVESQELAARSSVRLEALYQLGFAHWLAQQYDEAEAIALRAIAPDGDILTARVIALRGWIDVGRARYARALRSFRDAWRVYASCSARDVGFAASTVHAVATYDLELLERDDEPRYYQDDFPSASTTTVDAFRLLICEVDAWRAAIAGDEYRAIEASIRMETTHASPYWGVFGLATRAMISQAFDHAAYSRAFAHAGFSDAHSLDWNASPAESRTGLLYVAESLAPHDAERAQITLGTFSRIREEVSPRFRGGKSLHQRAITNFSRGVVALNAGDINSARERLRAAHAAYSELGFLRNATAALLLLGDEDSPDGRRLYRAARDVIVDRFPRSYLARRLRGYTPPVRDAGLTPSLRCIVSSLCAGRTPREIAGDRGTSVGTVYNQLKEVYRRTDLHSIQALVSRYGRASG